MSCVNRARAHVRRTARRRDQRGSVLVEFAFVAPLLFMLVFGIFSGGTAYNRSITLTSASREAARYATTHGTPTTVAGGTLAKWLTEVGLDAQNNAQGELDPSTDLSRGRSICVAYVPSSSGGSNSTWTGNTAPDPSNPPTPTVGTCGQTVTASSTDNQVVVVVKRNATLSVVAFSATLNLHSQAFGRVEK
jgi:Flp pilus assembly protein TadG